MGATAEFNGVIPDGCKHIGDYFGYQNRQFNTAITFPTTLETIGDHFLDRNTTFNQDIVIPNGVKTIGTNFLEYATSFAGSITLPESITNIGECFVYARSVKSVQPISVLNISAIADPDSVTLGDNFLFYHESKTIEFKIKSGTVDKWKTKIIAAYSAEYPISSWPSNWTITNV